MRKFRANYIDFLPFDGIRKAFSTQMQQDHIPGRNKGYYHMSMTCVNDKLFIFGGIDRTRIPKEGFVRYDLTTKKSKRFAPKDNKRDFFNVRSASCSKYGNFTFFFGGLSSNNSTLNRKRIFQVVKFDFRKGSYESQLFREFGLRYGHTTVIHNDKAYLYGGDFVVNDPDVYILDCHKMESFKKVVLRHTKSDFRPKPAFGHGAVVINHFMYIFFGAVDNFGHASNQVARLNLKKNEWEEVFVGGKMPRPRFGIGCVKSKKTDRVYIFGGSEGSSKLTNELLEFDHRLNIFRSIEILGNLDSDIPEPRFGHSVALSDDKNEDLYVFGGVTGRLRCDYNTTMCVVSGFGSNFRKPIKGLTESTQYKDFIDCVIITEN